MDPKSIVCEHFRAGQCAKGHKCKYSHDLNVERKGGKAGIYGDEEDKQARPGPRALCPEPCDESPRRGGTWGKGIYIYI